MTPSGTGHAASYPGGSWTEREEVPPKPCPQPTSPPLDTLAYYGFEGRTKNTEQHSTKLPALLVRSTRGNTAHSVWPTYHQSAVKTKSVLLVNMPSTRKLSTGQHVVHTKAFNWSTCYRSAIKTKPSIVKIGGLFAANALQHIPLLYIDAHRLSGGGETARRCHQETA